MQAEAAVVQPQAKDAWAPEQEEAGGGAFRGSPWISDFRPLEP